MKIPLTISDIIQILSIIITTAISIISVCIALSTLKQNNRMIEASSRPYVIVYGVVTNFQSPIYKIVVKNLGKTGAVITNFSTDHDLANFKFASNINKNRPFENLCNSFIAPNQSYICAINYENILKQNIDIINFHISYKSEDKIYNESIALNVTTEVGLLSPRASTNDKELKIISYTLQDLVDKNL